jgi:hypothetical protein
MDSAAHSKMDDERFVFIQIGQNVFCPAPQAQDAPAHKALLKIDRKRNTEILPADFDASQESAFH